MEELFKKVYIKTEADLPKESDYYITDRSVNTYYTKDIGFKLSSHGDLVHVAWYLQPCPPQLREVTFEELDDKAEDYASREDANREQFIDGAAYDGFVDGFKWCLEQMKGGAK